MKNIHSILFGLLALFAFMPQLAFAQATAGIKISPTLIEEKGIEPGMVKDYVITVSNPSDADLHLYTKVKDIVGVGPDGLPIYAQASEEDTYRLSTWVTFREKAIDLAPGQGAQVHVTVHVPKDVAPGGHFGSLVLTQEGPKDVPLGTGVGFEVGTILSLQVAGEVVEKTMFRSFFADKMIYGSPEAKFTLRIENLGNVVARPRGLIDITNMWGRKVASLPVNEGGAGVFPKSTRDWKIDWKSDELQFGKYEALASLAVEGTKGNQTIWSKTTFWILPTNILYPTVGGLLGFALVLYIMIRVYIRRQLAQYGSSRARAVRRGQAPMSPFASIVIALLIAVIVGFILLFLFFG